MFILFLYLAAIGVIVWAITTYIPMQQPIKNLILFVAIICAVVVVLQAFGLMHPLSQPVPRVR